MPKIKDARLTAINKNYLAGAISAEEAYRQVLMLIEALYKADGVQVSRHESNAANERLVNSYMADVINKRKTKKISKASLQQYLLRGVRAFGEHSLLTADIAVLQQAIDAAYPDQRQRQIVTYLNSLLKWAGRKDKLEQHRKQPREVRYIPLQKLNSVLGHLPSEAWQVAVELAANSGLRIGELFALDSRATLPNGLKVAWQIDRDGSRVPPKNGKQRKVACFNRALEVLDRWLELKGNINLEERRRAAEYVRAACKAAYPTRYEWHLTFHDLRHSYAVACAERGMSLDWIAKQLGDRIEVAEEYYIGFIQTDSSLDAAHALLNKSG